MRESQRYLDKVVGLMRLSKAGNIYIPERFVYAYDDILVPRKPAMSIHSNRFVSREPSTIRENEIEGLNDFIRNTMIPLDRDFPQLGFENFQISYEIMYPNIAFLTLMLSVEALLRLSNQHELCHRVSRWAAFLLAGE